MVAIHDISKLAAELVQQNWTGRRVVELEGSSRIAPLELGAVLSKVLKRQVRVESVPRD
jgi:NAD(P)H dehydrogenase (quinone)